jgi:hypothetical protein
MLATCCHHQLAYTNAHPVARMDTHTIPHCCTHIHKTPCCPQQHTRPVAATTHTHHVAATPHALLPTPTHALLSASLQQGFQGLTIDDWRQRMPGNTGACMLDACHCPEKAFEMRPKHHAWGPAAQQGQVAQVAGHLYDTNGQVDLKWLAN